MPPLTSSFSPSDACCWEKQRETVKTEKNKHSTRSSNSNSGQLDKQKTKFHVNVIVSKNGSFWKINLETSGNQLFQAWALRAQPCGLMEPHFQGPDPPFFSPPSLSLAGSMKLTFESWRGSLWEGGGTCCDPCPPPGGRATPSQPFGTMNKEKKYVILSKRDDECLFLGTNCKLWAL